jgi:Cu/Ag efflux pump CusA
MRGLLRGAVGPLIGRNAERFVASLAQHCAPADRAVLGCADVQARIAASFREGLRPGAAGAARDLELQVERALLSFPEIETVVSKTGRADIASDPMGLEVSDVIANLRPRREWRTTKSRDELVELIRTKLEDIPGMTYSFSQPIQLRVDELVSGVKAQIAVKLFGDDLDVLREKGEAVQQAIGWLSIH